MQTNSNAARKESCNRFDIAHFLVTRTGGITPEEGQALARHAADSGFGDIVTIGDYHVSATVALAHGLSDFPQSGQQVVCIDTDQTRTDTEDHRGDILRALLESGLYDRISLVNLSSHAVAGAWCGPIGLLYIDGGNTHAGVSEGIENWESHVEPGGYLIFRDMQTPANQVAGVIDELLASRRFEEIERAGKIIILRKLSSALAATVSQPDARMRILVVCHELINSGGLLRFERLARELCAWGHELCFATFADQPVNAWQSEFPVLDIETAARQTWTATMVPGAGFPDQTIERFAQLKHANFGYRVQHILNDSSRKDRFMAVNRAFAPDQVIFNNTHWEPGTYTDMQARKFSVLQGAVDTGRFYPAPYRRPLADCETVVIGGLANKNPAPLLAAIRLLPAQYSLRLFGDFTGNTRDYADLLSSGRLQLAGRIDEQALPDYFSSVDLVVHTEAFAGWANLAAEAMASGVPLICTRHGTTAFAQDGETARILEDISPDTIATAVQSLHDDPSGTTAMVRRARQQVLSFDWSTYASKLAALLHDDGKFHYTLAPELGLHGKWPLADRFKDLQYVLDHCKDASVIDFGCAEGVIARSCLERGARLVHGLELDESRVNTAAGLCSEYPNAHFFFHANLDDWHEIRDVASQVLLPTYDIVLYLGIQHHLARPQRLATLADAIAMTGSIFAIRTTAAVYRDDDIETLLDKSGFKEIVFDKSSQRDGFGVARIFIRR